VELKHPWLLSLHNISYLEADSMQDAIKSGYSVVSKSVTGRRAPEVYINPKNNLDAGYEGKFNAMDVNTSNQS